MRRLVLIKHSRPLLRDDVPAGEWRLGTEGIARAQALAIRVHPGAAAHVFTSREPKAVETAHLLADQWALPVKEVVDLHEHQRPAAGLMAPDVFEGRIRELFARPHERVLGVETADQARRRFTFAVMRLVTHTTEDVIIVSHGTVIALFVAEATGMEPFALWRRLALPSAVTMTLPELTLDEILV